MPIDPSIIMGIRPVQIQHRDPLESYGKSLTLQNLMRQGDLQGLQFEEAQRGADANKRIAALFAANPKATSADVMGIDPTRGLALRKAEGEEAVSQSTIGKNKAAQAKSEFDVNMGKLEHGAALLNEAKDPQSFETVLRVGQIAGTFTPEFVAQVRQQGYSPQLVKSLQAAGVKRAQQMEAEHKAATLEQTKANDPFLPGPNGPVPQVPVQQFQLDKSKKSAPNVTVKTDVKMGESLASQVGPMMRESVSAAEGAVKQVDAAHRIVRAIDSGKIITGPLANQRVTIAQVGQMLGVGGKDEAERLFNTRQAIRGLAELTLQGRQQMRGQGAITESEGKLAEKAMSGDISELTAAEVRQLARASERSARFNFNEHQRKLKTMQDNPELTKLSPFYSGPAMPAELPDPMPPKPAASPDAVRAEADAILKGGRGNR